MTWLDVCRNFHASVHNRVNSGWERERTLLGLVVELIPRTIIACSDGLFFSDFLFWTVIECFRKILSSFCRRATDWKGDNNHFQGTLFVWLAMAWEVRSTSSSLIFFEATDSSSNSFTHSFKHWSLLVYQHQKLCQCVTPLRQFLMHIIQAIKTTDMKTFSSACQKSTANRINVKMPCKAPS